VEITNKPSSSEEIPPSYNFTASDFARGIRILQGYGVIHWEAVEDGKQSIEFKTWYRSVAGSFDLKTYMQAVKNLENFKGYMTLGEMREWCRAAKTPNYAQLTHKSTPLSGEEVRKRIKTMRKELNM
jgi:hypothetical protein